MDDALAPCLLNEEGEVRPHELGSERIWHLVGLHFVLDSVGGVSHPIRRVSNGPQGRCCRCVAGVWSSVRGNLTRSKVV
jgi:hypothetical protein